MMTTIHPFVKFKVADDIDVCMVLLPNNRYSCHVQDMLGEIRDDMDDSHPTVLDALKHAARYYTLRAKAIMETAQNLEAYVKQLEEGLNGEKSDVEATTQSNH